MILVIDNYDSFTYNLVQLLQEALGDVGVPDASADADDARRVVVVRNDAAAVDALLARRPAGIVLSPGPGRPEDAGVCLDLLRAHADVPTLGVCLGHQCLGQATGAVVGRAVRLMHGKTSMVRYDEDPLFAGLSNPFQATRYHSLTVEPETVPDDLETIAWADDGTVMALRHRALPHWGVQFHPESVLTPEGPALLRNFLAICGLEPGPITPPVSAEALAEAAASAAPSTAGAEA